MAFDPRKVYGELGTHLSGVEAQARNQKYNPAPEPAVPEEPDPGLDMEAEGGLASFDLGSEIDSLGDDDITALLGPPDPDPAVEPASPELMADQGQGSAEAEPDMDGDDETLDLGALEGLEGL